MTPLQNNLKGVSRFYRANRGDFKLLAAVLSLIALSAMLSPYPIFG